MTRVWWVSRRCLLDAMYTTSYLVPVLLKSFGSALDSRGFPTLASLS